jgi:MFS family permease
MERSTTDDGHEPLVRSRTFPLLAAYWSFGQFWGVWVILVLEFQRHHSLTDSHLGLLYSLLSVAAIAIAAVATVGYTGFVWSPPLLGWIADTVDLRAAMGVIVLATVGIIPTRLFARRTTKA